MSFLLPPANHPARELMGDVASLAETLNPANLAQLPAIWQARKSALRMFEADTTRAMRRIAVVILRADSDERWLVTFGRRGGWRKEWSFGSGR